MNHRVWILGHGDAPTAPIHLEGVPLERNALYYTFSEDIMSHKGVWKQFELDRKRPLTAPVQEALQRIDWKHDIVLWQGMMPILGALAVHGHGNKATCAHCKKEWEWPPMAAPGSLSPESRRVKSMHTQMLAQDWSIEKVDRLLSHKCGNCAAPLLPNLVLPGQEIAADMADKVYDFIRKHPIDECLLVDTDLRHSYARCMIRMCRGKGARITHVTSFPEHYTWHKVRETHALKDGMWFACFDQRENVDGIKHCF